MSLYFDVAINSGSSSGNIHVNTAWHSSHPLLAVSNTSPGTPPTPCWQCSISNTQHWTRITYCRRSGPTPRSAAAT